MAEISNIFNFLKEFNEISNPIITEVNRQRWSLKLIELPQIEEMWSIYDVMDFENDKILEIKRPILTPSPTPKKSLIPWIQEDWKNIENEKINYRQKITEELLDEEGNIKKIDIYFQDNKNRVKDFNEWVKKREAWQRVELPKKQGLNLYNRLYSLYADMKKEAESVELVLGDGRIKWNLYKIDHPVYLQKVKLEFNSDKPSFIVKCKDTNAELYAPMLRIIPTIDQEMLSYNIQEVEEKNYHVADSQNTSGFFKRLINTIDKEGKYVAQLENNHNGPMIINEPILFLRKRTLGFSEFIDSIIEDIKTSDNQVLPDFFENMLGHYKEKKNQETEVIEDNWNENGIDQDTLLTLPANNEQLKIIKYLDKYGAVLVQGPPGTGKTHTIANLIGHLLSQGNNVLVTSHTEKALTVLKEKVYKQLQSLCISLLSSSSERKEMDSAIFELAEKSSSIDKNQSKKKINKLLQERKELIEQYKLNNKKLIKIRSLEYKDLVYDNETIKPIEASKFIKNGEGKIDYIDGITHDDTIGLPLSIGELEILYKSNDKITQEEEQLLNKDTPNLEDMWDSIDFINRKHKIELLKNKIYNWKPIFELSEDAKNLDLDNLLEKSKDVYDELLGYKEFQYNIINKVINDSVYHTFWEQLFEEFEALMINYKKWRKILFENEIENSLEKNQEILTILDEIINTNKEIPVSGLTSLLKPKWKKLAEGVKINKNNIKTLNEFKIIRFIMSYELQRETLFNKTKKLIDEVSDNELLNLKDFEEKFRIIRKKIKKALEWQENTWNNYIELLKKNVQAQEQLEKIFILDDINPIQSISKALNKIIIFDLQKQREQLIYQNSQTTWNSYIDFMKNYEFLGYPFKEFIESVIEKNEEGYKYYFAKIKDIYHKKEINAQRKYLIGKLRPIAPQWAKDVSERKRIHGKDELPTEIHNAWKWRQLSNQIKRINSYDPNTIQKEINRLNKQLMNNAKTLAYEKAWYKKIVSTTDEQTQAIEGWRKTIKQIGKGTGKNAAKYKKKARELMPKCQSAIPVWIMPLNRVVENFDPRENKFDVIIIDEASQANILALSALYLGKKVIIVGDDEQVSPDSVGINSQEVNALIEQHLQDIPKINHLFNEQTSIYDMAKLSGFKPLMLTEHFRCLPEIIEFSNQLSYNGKIKPLRDSSGVNISPTVVEYRVPDGLRSNNKINEKEAEHIASLVCACTENDNYKDKTIGVISLLGDKQAYEIDRLLQTYLDPKEYEERKIQCGIPPQFQGDERDIIFLSIVEGPKENGGPVRLVSEDGRNDMYRKRYNVAASRAKDQMWVVHSLNPEIDLKPNDLRLKLIKHAINPSLERNNTKLEQAESDFEIKVMETLLNKGYKVIPQWKVGTYRIDMVVENGENRIALECDGEKWHTSDDLPNDLKRQAILERLGWRFIRIRGSAYYRNPEETMARVFSELQSYNIEPHYNKEEQEVNNHSEQNILIEEIKRKAEDIRRSWNQEEDNESEEKEEVKTEDKLATISEKMTKGNKVNKVNKKENIKEDSDYEQIAFERVEIKSNNISKKHNKDKLIDQITIFDNAMYKTPKKNQRKFVKESNPKRDIFSENKKSNKKKQLKKPLFDFRKKQ